MDDTKKIDTQYPVHPLIEQRWSPVIFSSKPIEDTLLFSLFEAARLAPSSYNEQPWRFLIARHGSEEFDKMISCLVPFNQGWAKKASVVLFSFVKLNFTNGGEENPHARHDLGLAMGNLSLQATAQGLFLRQIAGVQRELVHQEYTIPEGFDFVAAAVIGYRDQDQKEGELIQTFKKRENSQRTRLVLDQILFQNNLPQEL